MLQDSLKLIILGNVLIRINSVNHLIYLYFRLHFILKYCIVGYIIAYIYSFQVLPVAFDYSRVTHVVVNSYLNFVAGFAVLLQLQSGVPGAGIFCTLEFFLEGNMFYLSNYL